MKTHKKDESVFDLMRSYGIRRLALETKISPAYLSLISRGLRNPNPEMARKIVETVGASPERARGAMRVWMAGGVDNYRQWMKAMPKEEDNK